MVVMMALGLAAITAVPWMLAGRFVGAIIGAVLSFVLGFIWVYFGTPSIAGPFFGGLGLIALFFTLVSGVIALFTWEERTRGRSLIPFAFAAIAVVLFVCTAIFNTTVFRARDYAALAPNVQARQWSADFQPKDPRHFRVSSTENALALAVRAMGQATTIDTNGRVFSIGSQFSVSGVSLQIIDGALSTIVSLDWSNNNVQQSATPGIPGYIKVSGENPILPAEFVHVSPGRAFVYTPQARWESNLDRLVWYYHPNKYIADTHLEIDDEGNPFYIVSMAEPTIGWWGEKVIGALIIDPVTGKGVETIVPVGKEPAWVDRVEALDIVHRNIDYHSKYVGGWINKAALGVSVLSATETHFGYGSDGQPVFATGITAQTNNSSGKYHDSLVAVYYTNTRTGETVEYMMQGGLTEAHAIEQCNLLGDVSNRKYHASTPQLYNVYGHISWVVPLQNQAHAFAGVCVVDVMNFQVVAWGPNAHDAVASFKAMIVTNGSQIALDGTRKTVQITGSIDRIGIDLITGPTPSLVRIVHLEGYDHLFLVPSSTSAKVPVTRVGDTVTIEYYASGEETLSVAGFDNISFPLSRSANEAEVSSRANAALAAAKAAQEQGRDVEAILKTLPPDQQALLRTKLKSK